MKHYLFHSHEQQDEFVFNVLDFKTNGIFLDVSCGNPLIGSNTASLEKHLNWQGFCFDIVDVESRDSWSSKRSNPFVRMNATSTDFTDFLKSKFTSNSVVDYVSLDIDADSIQALQRILDANLNIATLTFEHEFHRLGDTQRQRSRDILKDAGMVRLFEDVRFPGVLNNDHTSTFLFEDWWINPKLVNPSLLSIQNSQQYYRDSVEQLKQFKNHQYTCQHLCSQSWPNEYSLFWRPDEEVEFKQKFKIFYDL
jgi:hypothetical protein